MEQDQVDQVNREKELPFLPTWEVGIRLSDGWIEYHPPPPPARNPKDWSEGYIYGAWAVGRSTVSEEHAMKVAVEERQRWLREHPLYQ